MLYFSELFLYTCIFMTWKHWGFLDWKQWFLFCVWNFTLDLYCLCFSLQCMHGFYLLVSFIFAPQGTHLNDRVDAANKRAVKILRDQWNLSFYMLNKFCAPRCQIKNYVYKTSLLRDTTHEQTLYKRLLSTTCSIIWFMSLNSFTITWIDERYLKFLQISPNMFHRCDTVKSTFSWSVSNETF